MTNYLILIVLIVFIGAFIAKFGELFVALPGLLKWLAIPLLIALLIYGLSVIWPSIQQFFSKIPELFSKIPELFSKIPELFSKIPGLFSKIPELFSKIPGLFSDIISWFMGTL